MRFLRAFLIVFGVLLAMTAGVLSVGAWQYYRGMAIDTPDGIDEAGYVRIGGIDQWVQIRGHEKSNPVLLWLSGGPGASSVPLTYFMTAWEKYFTVVMWDQRGEGKTLERSGNSVAPTMTIDRMAQDGLELTGYLRGRLHKRKIILLGHSWGSILGVHMVKRQPDLFYAYVGTGQMHNLRSDTVISYPRLLTRALALNNLEAVHELQAAGPPPYLDETKYFVPLNWAGALDPSSELEVSFYHLPAEFWNNLINLRYRFSEGGAVSGKMLLKPIQEENTSITASELDVPVFVIEGSDDLITPGAKVWLDGLKAPDKRLFQISGGGHDAIIDHRFEFLSLLVAHVRALARSAP